MFLLYLSASSYVLIWFIMNKACVSVCVQVPVFWSGSRRTSTTSSRENIQSSETRSSGTVFVSEESRFLPAGGGHYPKLVLARCSEMF